MKSNTIWNVIIMSFIHNKYNNNSASVALPMVLYKYVYDHDYDNNKLRVLETI